MIVFFCFVTSSPRPLRNSILNLLFTVIRIIIFLTNEPASLLLNSSPGSSGMCPLLPAVFLTEVNLYKSMEVNLLRRLCARSGCGGTPSPLVTEHPSSPQWRLSGAVTSRSPLTPSPPSPPPHPKNTPPPHDASYSSQDNEVVKIDFIRRRWGAITWRNVSYQLLSAG